MNSENIPVELVCDPGCLLGEGPLWHQKEQRLYFTDIEERCLWKCNPATGLAEKFWQGEFQIGGFAFNRDGNLILCAENKVLKLFGKGVTEILFELDFPATERFNDITTDPQGRIYAGTMDIEGGPGRLLRLEKGCRPKLLLTEVYCSNGMTFSLDEKYFFHTNTCEFRITKYDYDLESGNISNGKVFFQGIESMGLPDGLTIDNEDCLWAAFWDASVIRRFSPDGKIIKTVQLPAKRPTSVIFGGDKLDTLYITTASVGRISADNRVNENGEFLGGSIYRFENKVHGRPEWRANF